MQKLINDLETTSANDKKNYRFHMKAFLLDDEINFANQERIASQMNGFIVTDMRVTTPVFFILFHPP